jgi:hypothetical protein
MFGVVAPPPAFTMFGAGSANGAGCCTSERFQPGGKG